MSPDQTVAGTTRVPAAAHRVALAAVTEEPLDLAGHERAVGDRTAGAVVGFAGVVRDHDGGRTVVELEYSGHPSAASVVAVSHRVGLLRIGDIALACAVSAAHRAEAFSACAELVDTVKQRTPIWKRQLFADGSEEWVDCP